MSAPWGVIILTLARKQSRLREANETHHTANRTPLRRRTVILEKTFWLLVLAGTAAGLYKALVNDAPMNILLAGVWLMIVGSGHLFLIGLVTAAKDVTDF